MSNVYKVLNVTNNNFDGYDRLQASLILNYCNPIVSLSFLKKSLSFDEAKKLGEMAGIVFSGEDFYDKNGNLIDNNVILRTIVDELSISARKSLENDGDSGYFLVNYVKEIIENKVLSKLRENEEDIITVDDLVAKLYGEKEEKGMVR